MAKGAERLHVRRLVGSCRAALSSCSRPEVGGNPGGNSPRLRAAARRSRALLRAQCRAWQAQVLSMRTLAPTLLAFLQAYGWGSHRRGAARPSGGWAATCPASMVAGAHRKPASAMWRTRARAWAAWAAGRATWRRLAALSASSVCAAAAATWTAARRLLASLGVGAILLGTPPRDRSGSLPAQQHLCRGLILCLVLLVQTLALYIRTLPQLSVPLEGNVTSFQACTLAEGDSYVCLRILAHGKPSIFVPRRLRLGQQLWSVKGWGRDMPKLCGSGQYTLQLVSS